MTNGNKEFVQYGQCWEDAEILLKGLDLQSHHTCLTVASAGDSALALLTRSPQKIIAIDINPTQLYCLELRVAAYQTLTHGEFLELLGVKKSVRLIELYQRSRPLLSEEGKNFWDHTIKKTNGIIFAGKLEKLLSHFQRWFFPMIHSKKIITQLFVKKSPQERKNFFVNEWNNWRWRLLIKLIFSPYILKSFNSNSSFDKSFYAEKLKRLEFVLTQQDPSENPYLQWMLTGSFQTLPFSLKPENYELIRKNIHKLEWHCISIQNFLDKNKNIDRFHLANVFDYLSTDQSQDCYEKIQKTASDHARLIYWSFLSPRLTHDNAINTSALFKQDHLYFYYRQLNIKEIIK